MNTTWNQSTIFTKFNSALTNPPSTKEWENATAKFVAKWQNNNEYLTNPTTLLQALNEYESWQANYGLEPDYVYFAWLKSSLEQNNTQVTAYLKKLEDISNTLLNSIQFFELNLGKIEVEMQKSILQDSKFSNYKHFLHKIFENAKYQLSEPEEKILNLKASSSYSSWVKMTSTLLSQETAIIKTDANPKKPKNLSQIQNLTSSTNQQVRDEAANKLNKILSKYKQIAEHELNAILSNKKVDDELRGFVQPDQARHINDDVSSEVVAALSTAVTNNFKTSADFYALKAKLLGKSKLNYHERNVPIEQSDENYTYEQAIKIVNKVTTNLDPEFNQIFNNYINNNLIDVLPVEGKVSGAFCARGLITQPSYIMLNFTGKLRDVVTLAHELGHGINNELIKKSQNSLNFNCPLSTAEVASTFFEDFVLQEVISKLEPKDRLPILMEKLNDEISTIHRQIACYNFEKELHAKHRETGYLSYKQIGELFTKHMSSYMGESVSQDLGSENWWIYWGHIRRFFYNYSYASGLLISKAMQAKYKQDPKFIIKVKEFLSVGTSMSPYDAFKNMGIDISDPKFWQIGLTEIKALLNECEKLAGK